MPRGVVTAPTLDLNADVGEHDGLVPPAERALLRLVTSASIACGWHAGDATSMRHTVAEAAVFGVQVGAHPSYPDREGFGRRVLRMTPLEVMDAVAHQVHALCAVAVLENVKVRHVKPHGALYTSACADTTLAAAIVSGIVAVDRDLALYAPPASALARAGHVAGLRVVAEGFLDRAYEDAGSLTPRLRDGAVLSDAAGAAQRALDWIRTGRVRTRRGGSIPMSVQTLCVHGDTPDAADLAARVRAALEDAGVLIRSALS